ncbi:MAG: hypothetical protein CSA55_05540 [Ilumatobacter coccineus]|uniref:Nucleotidyl transferase domain-containing protein n=1 Tax=Ilumatobacter coccineus TaxID=467094 RepID=A0A2G6K791_9ACTN|nr:MAG: hypothetical protein CSA55_05540 [Ilumatobacter coccineus]
MLTHVIHAFSKLSPRQTVVVVGHESDWVARQVTASAPEWANVVFAHQHEQHGTGHATASGMSILDPGDNTDNAVVVVVPGDAPLLTADTLNELVSTHVANNNAATLLTSLRTDPTGYGRIIRAGDDRVMRIVEQGDASPEELDVKEVCTSIYAFQRNLLAPALDDLNTNNSQGEFYLTDVIEGLAAQGRHHGRSSPNLHRCRCHHRCRCDHPSGHRLERLYHGWR